ncbi:MAG: lipid IV(A) 3-deoxy-D-manno-octulosonic acid transferase [Propionivibrio sp.]|uniref:lipid IV(A) 3-deoxy-D-manno-octulosonic acid transferase n=1 Tax=Propionivibrio sp. TaxID=2212460 RepID=UPI001B5F591B|nr:lipid IV(A) 3-deoxy-D-manno-octulosonic acid transferase [Propionivibrio sp.]MBP7204621.1 lipid IV(A) 3-deoxy-D-manno-octulosonic acid transferase [Propionivibrio sp.]
MNRLLYSLLFYLAQPLIWLRLAWRARKQAEYLRHVGERYGFYPAKLNGPLLWLHVVSVGETRAAEPLIKALLDEYPGHALLLTHMTPTGRATGGELLAKYGTRLSQAYLPYDLPGACARFLDHFKPQLGLLMETELWPNLIAAATKRSIPLALVNARLSARSQRGYLRFPKLIRPALASLRVVAAQTAADAERLTAIGAQRVSTVGNIKFDVTPSAEKKQLGAEWRQALGNRPVWLAASTREGEEALVLDAFARIRQPDLLLLLVPRHPQRFAEVATLVQERKLALCRRSEGSLPTAETRVWLGDSMGEMPAYFSVADIALIGGTLLPFGGQNLIEAAACGCPVLVGPHTFNFLQATEDSIACCAARRIADANEAASAVETLLKDRAALRGMRDAAMTFSQAHRGATARTMALIRSAMAR